MSFVVSLCWLKRGIAKTPSKLKLEKEELQKILKSKQKKGKSKNKSKNKEEKVEDEEQIDDENIEEKVEEEINEENNDENGDDIAKKYGLENYDEENDENVELKADDIGTLACFASNDDDNLLTIKNEGEDSDEEDFEIKATDNLLICGQADKEVCTLNAYVYNEFEPCFYIHHDIILPSYPLCVEWLDYDSTVNNSVNYLAIGTLNPWIEIWDLDFVDTLEPEFLLAPEKIKEKSKKVADKTICKINGHKDAVLDLSWNKLNRNVLASGSADKTIVLWDLDTLKQATKIKHHKDKIQTIKFHPIETFSLLSGSFDQTVALYDCRNPDVNYKTWDFSTGDVEKVIWNHHSPNYFLACTEQGYVYMCDIRQEKPLINMQAHELSVTGLALSSNVPGLLVTTSSDEVVKVWDIKDNTLDLVYQKNINIGAINCVQASPDSQFLFAFGGELSNEPHIWDIRESKNVREAFYPRMNIEFTKDELETETEENNGEEDGVKKNKRTKNFKSDTKAKKKKFRKNLKPKKGSKKVKKDRNIKKSKIINKNENS